MFRAAARCLIAGCVISLAAPSHATDLILNEANAVGSQKWLANPDTLACTGPGGFACSAEEDVYFGRVMNNGGDWIELIVTTDHLDVRGWQLRWAETDNAPGQANHANGADIWFGDGTVEQGVITFSDDPHWSDLRLGTILTITEKTAAQGGLDTDWSFDPCAGDMWINVNSFDTQSITTVINVLNGDILPPYTQLCPPGSFNVGNDAWELTILDSIGDVKLGPIGEAYAGGPGWAGSGVNSRETIRLSENPSSAISVFSFYEDCDKSSFAHANRWGQNISPGVECERSQDLRPLRTWVACSCARVVLNEYNAVGSDKWLNNPDSATGGCPQPVGPGGAACAANGDTHFGRVMGNGGDWFELLVTDDHVDMRGWTLVWEEVKDSETGAITLSDSQAWSNLRAGTIITFVRDDTAAGGMDTDLSYNPATGDRWINVWTKDASLIAATTSTVRDHGFGDFHTSNDDWRLTILNASDAPVSMTSGEGAPAYAGRGIGSNEVANLQQDATAQTRAWDLYTESVQSTFGSLNSWTPCPGSNIATQQLTAITAAACTRAPDIDANGTVDIDDLFGVINAWGPCPGGPSCGGDIDQNGVTDVDDLFAVINGWG